MVNGEDEYLLTGILYTLISIPLEKRDALRERLTGKRCQRHVSMALLLDAARFFECQQSKVPVEKGFHLN